MSQAYLESDGLTNDERVFLKEQKACMNDSKNADDLLFKIKNEKHTADKGLLAYTQAYTQLDEALSKYIQSCGKLDSLNGELLEGKIEQAKEIKKIIKQDILPKFTAVEDMPGEDSYQHTPIENRLNEPKVNDKIRPEMITAIVVIIFFIILLGYMVLKLLYFVIDFFKAKENKPTNNQILKNTKAEEKHSSGFVWWNIWGILGLTVTNFLLIGNLQEYLTGKQLLSLLIFNTVLHIIVLMKNKYAFLISTILSGPLMWIINGVYLKHRWDHQVLNKGKELKAENSTKTNKALSNKLLSFVSKLYHNKIMLITYIILQIIGLLFFLQLLGDGWDFEDLLRSWHWTFGIFEANWLFVLSIFGPFIFTQILDTVLKYLDENKSYTVKVEQHDEEESNSKSIIYCSQCGCKNNIENKFCTECGNLLNTKA